MVDFIKDIVFLLDIREAREGHDREEHIKVCRGLDVGFDIGRRRYCCCFSGTV